MDRSYLRSLERKLVDDGKLIEAGWVGLRLAAIPEDAGATQLTVMREAFFAGAQHLLASIMDVMDDDHEPTADDLRRMDLIQSELDAFIRAFSRKHDLPGSRTQ